jgi:hypothetical protein
MEFTPESILMTIFVGVVGGLTGYLGSYANAKGQVRAATGDLHQTLTNPGKTTHAIEAVKARITADSTLESDLRKAVYELATASHSLVHSMYWLSWSARTRGLTRADLSQQYDVEAHKLIPEILGRMAVIKLIDDSLYEGAFEFVEEMQVLDVRYGDAIVLSETNPSAGTAGLAQLHNEANVLLKKAEIIFGRNIALRS